MYLSRSHSAQISQIYLSTFSLVNFDAQNFFFPLKKLSAHLDVERKTELTSLAKIVSVYRLTICELEGPPWTIFYATFVPLV